MVDTLRPPTPRSNEAGFCTSRHLPSIFSAASSLVKFLSISCNAGYSSLGADCLFSRRTLPPIWRPSHFLGDSLLFYPSYRRCLTLSSILEHEDEFDLFLIALIMSPFSTLCYSLEMSYLLLQGCLPFDGVPARSFSVAPGPCASELPVTVPFFLLFLSVIYNFVV